jgi:hypothetical protein
LAKIIFSSPNKYAFYFIFQSEDELAAAILNLEIGANSVI